MATTPPATSKYGEDFISRILAFVLEDHTSATTMFKHFKPD
jgi:hypothetical protein